MALIDFILNLAALLLWFGWRSMQHDPLSGASAATLAGTLKRAEPSRLRQWQVLGSLLCLLMLRALLYWQLGGAAEWTPRIDLLWVTLPFRSEIPGLALLFSFLSFIRVLVVIYAWLLVLSVINRGLGDTDPVQKLIRLQLGPVARWPWPIQLLLPVILTAVLWLGLHPLLVRTGVAGPVQSYGHLCEQGLLVGVSVYVTLKYLLPVLLLVHLVISYVYLGKSPLLDFITKTARQLLTPLAWAPLQLGKLDVAPVLTATLILVLLDALPNYLLHTMASLRMPIWPQ